MRGLVAMAVAGCAVVACSGRALPSIFDAGALDGVDASPVVPPQFLDGSATVHDGSGHLTGAVFAPNGETPISGALVYTTPFDPAPIPTTNYCDDCVHLGPGADYTFSSADGTFDLPLHSIGALNLVVQKGAFRRVRAVTLAEGDNTAAQSSTTLPGQSAPALGDSIPSIVVLNPDFDFIGNALVKFGLKTSIGFQIHSGAWIDFLRNGAALSLYQVIFLPCSDTTDPTKDPTNATVQQNLRDFVAAGGRVYVTDWSYDYVTQLWPHYVDLVGESSSVGSGWLAHENRAATMVDPGLAAWMTSQGIESWTAVGNWTTIDQVDTSATTVWVAGTGSAGEKPTTVSFPSACGKVMFSTYHAEGDVTSKYLTPQELALLYVLLEVNVCTDSSSGVVAPN